MIKKIGMIYLYSGKDDSLIAYYRYRHEKDRNRCIEIWRRRYAGKFNQCYWQIKPELPEDTEIKRNGENYKRKRKARSPKLAMDEKYFEKIVLLSTGVKNKKSPAVEAEQSKS